MRSVLGHRSFKGQKIEDKIKYSSKNLVNCCLENRREGRFDDLRVFETGFTLRKKCMHGLGIEFMD